MFNFMTKKFKMPNLQCNFWKLLYLYLKKFQNNTQSNKKKLFVVKTTLIFWLIDVNINLTIFWNMKSNKFSANVKMSQ